MELKFDWWGRLADLELNPPPNIPLWKLNQVVDSAAEFIDRWADWAELAKMQPVHLLRNDRNSPNARGLAWRWTEAMSVLCFPRENHLVVESRGDEFNPTLFAYRFEKSGGLAMLRGSDRCDILSTHLTLDTTPTIRARWLDDHPEER